MRIPTWTRLALVAATLGAFLLVPAAALAATGLSGTVTGPGALEEVEICVIEPLPSETCTNPGPDGKYQLLGINGGTYQVEFLPSYRSHLVVQYYNHKAKLSEANKVVVNAGVVTKYVDADLVLGGEIEGTARDFLGGTGIPAVEVCALDAVTGLAVSCAHTDATGAYALPAVPPGSYRVGFWGERGSAGYAPQYYAEKTSYFSATPVAVAAGETVTGVDAALREGARVSGSMTDAATGAPLAGISVCILAVGSSGPERCAYSGPNGAYELAAVVSGSYQVAFSPEFAEFAKGEFTLPEEDGWLTQYFGGSPDRAGATVLALSAPELRTGVDAALATARAAAPPAEPPPAPSVAIALPTVLPGPVARPPKKCRKGFRKRRVEGRVRCVKVRREHDRHKHRHPTRQRVQTPG